MRKLMNRVTAIAVVASSSVGLGLTISKTHADASTNVVYAWGYNGEGELGDGTTLNRLSPVPVPGLTGVAAISAGSAHSLAILSDSTVRAWGWNGTGALGDGTTTDRLSPVLVSGLTSVTSISAGNGYSLAVLSDGTVRAWGYNGDGELGDGTTTDRNTPVAVSGLTGVTSVAANFDHSLALLSDGTVRAWGGNSFGQIGDGTNGVDNNRTIPTAVPGLTGATSISSGPSRSLAVLSNGTVQAWGSNQDGQLGNDSVGGSSSVPVPVFDLSGVTSISAGWEHSLAVLSDGTVRAWGRNDLGQLGDGTTDAFFDGFITVPGLSNIVDVEAGARSSYALSAAGRLWVWGSNADGQLGLGDTADRLTPTEVLSPLVGYRFSSIAAGDFHVLAILEPVPAPAAAALFGLSGLVAVRRRRT